MIAQENLPAYISNVLDRFQNVTDTSTGWLVSCPCPQHNPDSDHPGDQHPSVTIAIGDEGKILVKCQVGCNTDTVLESADLVWRDLFRPEGVEPVRASVRQTIADNSAPKNVGLWHEAYSALLACLTLTEDHRQQLRARGLSDVEVDRRGYRSLGYLDHDRAAKVVSEKIGPDVLQVPGFTQGGKSVVLTGKSTGIVVPVRDLQGKTQALKIRREADADPKYVYLSSSHEGHSCGSPMHVPLGTPELLEAVRVTEGEFKADVCSVLDPTISTISVPGVSNWDRAIPLLREMEAKTVVLAFDAPDVHNKLVVFRHTEAFYNELVNGGFAVELEDWS